MKDMEDKDKSLSESDESEEIDRVKDEELKKEEKKNGRRKFFLGFYVGLITSVIGFNIMALINNGAGIHTFLTREEIEKLNAIDRLLDDDFYAKIPHKKKVDAIYKGLLNSANDKYTEYYNEKEYKDLKISLEGDYSGIGAVLRIRPDDGNKYEIIEVYKGSGAEEAGLKPGDRLISVDNKKTKSAEYMDDFVSKNIRGKAGKIRVISYMRNGKVNTVKVKLKNIVIPSVDSKMLKGKIGYIRISQFSSGTQKEFEKALATLKEQGMKKVIYDLRNNGGGMVDSVVSILDDILPKGKVVSIKDRNGKEENYYSDDKKQLDIPAVVLVNENTASASEIFTGAMRDFKKATIVGTKTFGKGIVQITYPLSDGSAVKVTNAKYFTPKGECIHKKGIKPDVVIEFKPNGQENDILKDNQVKKAIEVLNNK